MRERVFTLVQKAGPQDRLSKLYDQFIMAVAFISLLPLMFKAQNEFLNWVDLITVYILFANYVLQWICCDMARGQTGVRPFLTYPFTPYAFLTLLSLLPSMGLLPPGFRLLRIFRISVIFRYSSNFQYIARVFKKERRTLLTVLYIALFYIFISALAMFTYEPQTFDTFFDALYWATTALTTVGYGDVIPLYTVGRLISMVSSLFGIAIIALPAGIVTAGFVEEINKENRGGEPREDAPPEDAVRRPLFTVTPKVKRYALVMTLCLGLNLGLNALAELSGLPVWLDTTGTALAALLLDPAAGLLVGLADNMILAITEYGAASLLYYAVSAVVALVAGLLVFKNGKTSLGRVLGCVGLVIVLSTVLSAGVDIWMSVDTAPTTYWENHFYTMAQNAGAPHVLAYFFGELVVQTADTLATAGIVAVIYTLLNKNSLAKGQHP